LDLLNHLGAAATLILGVLSLFLPKVAARFVGLQALIGGPSWRSLADAGTGPPLVLKGRR